MIYEVIWTSCFKKGYKLCKKRGLPLEELKTVVAVLQKKQGDSDAYARGYRNAF